MSSVQVPALLEHQQPIGLSDAPNKVLRCGRRFGKTRFALNIAILGHGSQGQFRGITSGLDVIWLAPSFKQANRIWDEEIVPRFDGKRGVSVHRQDKKVTLQGAGSLWVASAEAMDTVRGAGAKLCGLIADEAAHFDLEHALQDVIRPALLDNEGWLVLMSTTNCAHDGNSAKVMPSYFNRICGEIVTGTRGKDGSYEEFYGTAYDNSKLRKEAIDALIEEYPAGSLALKQEVFAELVSAGAGLAFPEFTVQDHVCTTRIPPRSWRFFGSMDWGYRQGAYVEADEQMWQQIGAGVTLAEDFGAGMNQHFGPSVQPPALLKAVHKAGSRAAKKNSVHEMLANKTTRDKNGDLLPWARPKYRVQERCKETIRCYQTLPLDPKRPDDVDTTHPMDHVYDCDAFALTSRPPAPNARTIPHDWEHRDAGIDGKNKRVRDWSDKPERSGTIIPTLPSYQVPSTWAVSMSED
jgi:hypothetical protein